MRGVASPVLPERIDAARALLENVAARVTPIVFTTSFGAEDMVLLDLMASMKSIAIVSLDTGRLPQETYDLWSLASSRYLRKIDAIFPQAAAVEQLVRVNGINGFYDSVAQRKDCCHVRKVEPLERALLGKKGWITGLRRTQSAARVDLALIEADELRGLQKINPLADWAEADVWEYIRAFNVPYNALHDRGYPSIGCAPCTRAIKPGEDTRAGRWWWESDNAKECGLHVNESVSPL